MTRYIDTREDRDFTQEEISALWNRVAKPFPNSYYASEEEIIEYKNSNSRLDWEALSSEDKEEYFEQFVCPVNKWEYLSLSL